MSCTVYVNEIIELPTYRVALAFAGFITVSLAVEGLLHYLEHVLKHHRLLELVAALGKIKDELMILGFLALALLVWGKRLERICVQKVRHMAICRPMVPLSPALGQSADSYASSDAVMDGCPAGQEPWVSEHGLKDMDLLIFTLACTHVALCVIACSLSWFKVQYQFGQWERDVQEDLKDLQHASVSPSMGAPGSPPLQGAAGASSSSSSKGAASASSTKAASPKQRRKMNRLATMRTEYFSKRVQFLFTTFAGSKAVPDLSHDTSPVTFAGRFYILLVSFIHQFFISVEEEEYLAIRRTFTQSHGLSDDYDFHGYLQRINMTTFVTIVGTSWWLWVIAGFILLLSVEPLVLHVMSLFPIVLVLIIGTKLQVSLVHLGLDYLGVEVLSRKTKEHAAKMERREKAAAAAGQIEEESALDEAGKGQTGMTDKHGSEIEKGRDAVGTKSTAGNRTGSEYLHLLFWFGRPHLMLMVLHYVIFQCAYLLGYYLWAVLQFGTQSCIFSDLGWTVTSSVICFSSPLLLSYQTLPLFVLLNSVNPAHVKHSLEVKHGSLGHVH